MRGHVIAENVHAVIRGTKWSGPLDVYEQEPISAGRVMVVKGSGTTREKEYTFPRNVVRLLHPATDPLYGEAFAYWSAVVQRLPPDDNGSQDPTHRTFRRLTHVNEESALAAFLRGTPRCFPVDRPLIFPFSTNLSQQAALAAALQHQLSVVEGPPGTGKTQTILNLVANLVARGRSVGVVSTNNAAVDNVSTKLDELGLGFLYARLGNRARQEAFLASQPAQQSARAHFVAGRSPSADVERFTRVEATLTELLGVDRRRHELRNRVCAYELEQRHFTDHLHGHGTLPDLSRLRRLHRSPDRIIALLADTTVRGPTDGLRLRAKIDRYFKFGRLRGLDLASTRAILALESAFYEQRLAELRTELAGLDRRLERADLTTVLAEHRGLSQRYLEDRLVDRYASRPQRQFGPQALRGGDGWDDLVSDYPVMLSTCHSIGATVAPGQLLDYVVIDESSQVNVILGALAMAYAKNAVIVGDLRQLEHIPPSIDGDLPQPPEASLDVVRHNILSAVIERFSGEVPRTLLREHYRCDPAIIGYCNDSFYGGELVAYTHSTEHQPCMTVRRLVPGNHARRLWTGGRINPREAEVIVREVMPDLLEHYEMSDIGVISPYRAQVTTIAEALRERIAGDGAEIDTVHSFQGREKDVVVLATVLDESRDGHFGVKWVDDPLLINVAVSRASKHLVVVVNQAGMPRSRNIRRLIDYILYHDPNAQTHPEIVSIFDLLYREYADCLRPLAGRLRGEQKYRSEDIAWTVILELLAEEAYDWLRVVPQYALHKLRPGSAPLTPEQERFLKTTSSVDFAIYDSASKRKLAVIEVDGFAFHHRPDQEHRDRLKDSILAAWRIPILRLPTTGSNEEARLRATFDALLREKLTSKTEEELSGGG
ncbi:MAG: AAA domain-containing protein [Dermatophilaceae bacterium]